MTRALLTLLFVAAAVAASSSVRAQPDYEELNRALTDQVVVPAYRHMAEAMAGLDAATHGFCANPGADSLAAAKAAFGHAMDAWQRAQPIALGPVTWDGRASRIAFWPDKGGTAARQVRRALQAQAPDLLADGGLEGKSVALQSLATFERILYDSGERIAGGDASAKDRYACELAAAIARFQAGLSAQILADWTGPGGYRDAVLTAAAGNEYYAGADEAAVQFLKSISGTLDLAIQLKLEQPMGTTLDAARPKRAESWRSGRSLENVALNLETAGRLYGAPGGFGDLLAAEGGGALDIGLRQQFAEAAAMARSVGLPLRLAVSDAEARQRLEALVEALKRLRLLVAGPLADEIGLVVGFNALDGD